MAITASTYAASVHQVQLAATAYYYGSAEPMHDIAWDNRIAELEAYKAANCIIPGQAHHAQQLYDAGPRTFQRIADLVQVPRSTIYGHLNKASIGHRPTTKATLKA